MSRELLLKALRRGQCLDSNLNAVYIHKHVYVSKSCLMHPLRTKGYTCTWCRKGIALKGQKVRTFLKELKFLLQTHPRTLWGLGKSQSGLPGLAQVWWLNHLPELVRNLPPLTISFLLNTSPLLSCGELGGRDRVWVGRGCRSSRETRGTWKEK